MCGNEGGEQCFKNRIGRFNHESSPVKFEKISQNWKTPRTGLFSNSLTILIFKTMMRNKMEMRKILLLHYNHHYNVPNVT